MLDVDCFCILQPYICRSLIKELATHIAPLIKELATPLPYHQSRDFLGMFHPLWGLWTKLSGSPNHRAYICWMFILAYACQIIFFSFGSIFWCLTTVIIIMQYLGDSPTDQGHFIDSFVFKWNRVMYFGSHAHIGKLSFFPCAGFMQLRCCWPSSISTCSESFTGTWNPKMFLCVMMAMLCCQILISLWGVQFHPP